MTEVVIVDVGLGNLHSVAKALELAGRDSSARITRSTDPDRIRRADAIVVPGQSSFAGYVNALGPALVEVLQERLRAGTPYLGICLGLQVLFARSEEAPGCAGLGVFPGTVARLQASIDPATGTSLKIPHIGWNTVERAQDRANDEATILPAEPTHFYFVHSYVDVPDDPAFAVGTTEYGARFVSAVAKDNVLACQFHPEKSQTARLELLARFLRA